MLECNCTLCRRYGALWAYYEPGQVVVVQGELDTRHYSWQNGVLAFHWCSDCGCLTHFTTVKENAIRGVNVRMIPTLDPGTVEIRRIDNSHTGFFWTENSKQFIPGRHPKMPIPGPEDWR